HSDGLWNTLERSVVVGLYVTNAEQIEPTRFGLYLPATGVFPLECFKTTGRLEPGKAGGRTKFRSTIERGEGAIEALQRASAQGDARREDLGAHLTKSRQGATLIDVADRAPFPLPGTHALFEGGVIELALVVELAKQGLGLAKRRVQAITKR